MGLSTLGAGVGFAHGGDDAPGVTAVANSSANAVAVGGDFVQPQDKDKYEGQPEEQGNAGPEHEHEQGYGEHEGE
ncbi:hypothetical protein ABZ923_36255 [Streptomyces sp. NPDC046881]|uniref:hypothetical protein n=1 Tax=Streptomyces sp. NPDC046881 TaxID=3155374 RepID=UPI0033C30FA9